MRGSVANLTWGIVDVVVVVDVDVVVVVVEFALFIDASTHRKPWADFLH